MTIQSISKLDAATRQLHMAIVLYFQDADPICVHTLAGTAHGLLRDLLVRRGRVSSVRERDEKVQPEHRTFVTRMVNDAKNFLKHADRDPDHVLTFNTDWTDFLLYEAIWMHISLALDLTRTNIFFLLWITAKYPTVLLLDKSAADGIAELRRIFPKLGGVDVQRRTFLAALNNESPRVPDSE
jgi:hypothetical protein